MIETSQLLPLLVAAYPGLRDHFVATVDDWLREDGVITPCGLFREASHLVAGRFGTGDFDGAESLFVLVERCLAEGTQDLKDGAATCFLENLINRPETGPLAVPFMGLLSREYCRAWDAFTGVRTPGL